MAKEKENLFPLDEIDAIKASPCDYRLLKRIPISTLSKDSNFPVVLNERKPDDIVVQAIVLDTETTGLDSDNDTIIELGMVKFSYSKNRNVILSVDGVFDEYEDTDQELSSVITKITGISKEDIAGKKIDIQDVVDFIKPENTPLIIAHNAGFDRPFFDKRFDSNELLIKLPWACSIKEIPWINLDSKFSKTSLEFLNTSLGYFYDSHRADIDCLALLWVLNKVDNAFSLLRQNALAYHVLLQAFGAPFDIKNDLKKMGFRWNSFIKVWEKEILETEQSTYLDELKKLYTKAPELVKFSKKISCRNRYKK
ncbi:MAG: 3'-5' exonuclease [Succinivibrionaceae bacterium]